MTSILNPYLNFDGEAKAATEFYHSVFGGKVASNTYKEGGMTVDESEADKIMHAQLTADNGMTLMISDIPHGWTYSPGNNISVSLSGDNDAELRGWWDKLSAGAKIDAPLEKAPWGDTFGMLTDKFGIKWLVNITAAK